MVKPSCKSDGTLAYEEGEKMILFILIEIAILALTIFADDWLLYHIRKDIRFGTHKIKAVLTNIWTWFWSNVLFVLANMVVVFVISICAMLVLSFTQPELETSYSFNINALKDNLVTEGRLYGRRGYIDGELSYFFSRTMDKGEIIGHIPADKTYIRHDDTVRPRIEVYQSQIDIPEWVYKVFFIEWMNSKSTDYYVIVAPEGTIVNTGTYQIDME